MQPQLQSSRALVAPVWSTSPVAQLERINEPVWHAAWDRWIAAFTDRLAELQPGADALALRAVAADLWVDLGGHDPLIAAEMEHEAGLGA